MGVELHIETDKLPDVITAGRGLESTLASTFPRGKVTWDAEWDEDGSRIYVVIPWATPAEVAEAMVKLIEATFETVDNVVKGKKRPT